MPTTRTLFIDQYRLPASTDEFVSANRMRVTVGTNFPTGSTEHSRTVFILEDAGAEIRCGLNSEEVRPVDRIEIVLGGDPEYETFLDALKFAVDTLTLLAHANTLRDEHPPRATG